MWMTFNQSAELNAHVKKGEKGSLVVYANKITKNEDDGKGNEVERDIPFINGVKTVFGFSECLYLVEKLERETGVEPATSSLGISASVDNKGLRRSRAWIQV